MNGTGKLTSLQSGTYGGGVFSLMYNPVKEQRRKGPPQKFTLTGSAGKRGEGWELSSRPGGEIGEKNIKEFAKTAPRNRFSERVTRGNKWLPIEARAEIKRKTSHRAVKSRPEKGSSARGGKEAPTLRTMTRGPGIPHQRNPTIGSREEGIQNCVHDDRGKRKGHRARQKDLKKKKHSKFTI